MHAAVMAAAREIEREFITRALREHRDVHAAARALGIHEVSLYRKMRACGIDWREALATT